MRRAQDSGLEAGSKWGEAHSCPSSEPAELPGYSDEEIQAESELS